ncbi:hypothetical protein PFLCHA0_c48920 [Pseudomonas protegens CHA0]|uniref:DUF2132 domain-containing protein n=1 Tax=Pseudomonas protegens (strain DSM 19095 / LMG 27888 / CFBP 6595 / CHA0) TaxID=1124983 RepID=A0A2C9ESJ9_PSEPH|nr:hypothetical protein PFLCHA0_c48920 [Pseudomonas protegens CHA0]
MPDRLGDGLRLQLLKRAGAGPSPRLRCAAFLIFFPQRPGMTDTHTDPLHGVTLEQILKALVEHYEWSGLAERIDIRCFKSDPSIKSSLTFLRKTPWAREKVEKLYVKLQRTKRPL